MKFKFNHKVDNLVEALGIENEKEIEDLINKTNEIVDKCDKSSQVIENLTNKLNKHELAFLIHYTQMQQRNNPLDALMELMDKGESSSNDDDDNDKLPKVIPMGSPGKA